MSLPAPEPGEQEVTLATPVRELPGAGVGPRRAAALGRLEIVSVHDLVRHLPVRYEKHYAEGAIDDLTAGTVGTARGTLVATRMAGQMGRGKQRFEATLEDHSERLRLVWFSGGYLRHMLHPGMVLRVQGKVDIFNGYAQMVNPKWERLEANDQGDLPAPAGDRLCPVYPATESLSSAVIEELIAKVLPKVLGEFVDPLPAELLAHHHMPALAQAYQWIHQPAKEEEHQAARRRLAYNELLLLQLGIARKRMFNHTALRAPALRWTAAIDAQVRQFFPFTLTGAQDRVIREITADLRRSEPMNRLLQGDVGAGKTVVALYAMLLAACDRKQSALMAPTEILAEQHYAGMTAMLQGSNVRMELLTSGRHSAGERADLLQRTARGAVDILIGTQALLTQDVRFHDLAVVVIDEQHRFGVRQRAALRPQQISDDPSAWGTPSLPQAPPPDSGKQIQPHTLVMTATPIPRTLSLTVFGDLDVSTLDELPPGRSPIVTKLVGPDKGDEVYRYLAKRVARGEQMYVVVPTIDDQGRESAGQLKNLRAHVELLQNKYFPPDSGVEVAALHGRLERATRERIMARFRGGQVRVLAATTVIEVGVDVPAATLMVVEHAERFGLAQLHQLRGRIGRQSGGPQSLCVLIGEPVTEDAAGRLQAMVATTDGFKIAEADWEIRGMGELFGTKQHGRPPLRVATLPGDMALLNLARHDAQAMIAADPELTQERHLRLHKLLVREYGEALGLIDVG